MIKTSGGLGNGQPNLNSQEEDKREEYICIYYKYIFIHSIICIYIKYTQYILLICYFCLYLYTQVLCMIIVKEKL